MFVWNDYHSYDLDALVALQVETRDRIRRGVQCDNFAPGTCCDDCNFYIINEVLAERLSAPVEV